MKLSCDQLKFSYTGNKLIRKLSLQASSNEPIWIRGRSGAGKSTFLKLISGLLKPEQGQIRFDEVSLSELSKEKQMSFRQQNIGYVHQENHLINHWTVQQNLSLIESDITQQKNTLEKLKLDVRLLNQTITQLSGGERQRTSLARLILQNPKYAFVDEPTSHLDDENTELVIALLKEHFAEKILIVVSHDHRFSNHGFKEIDFSVMNA